MQPSCTFSCFVAISGRIGIKSRVDFPELSTMSLMQPTNDSIMYFTPCSRSSELKPKIKRLFYVLLLNRMSNLFDPVFRFLVCQYIQCKIIKFLPPIKTTDANSSETP